MEALKMMEPYWEQLKRLAVYAQYCAGSDMHVAVCRDFWIWSAIGAFSLAAIIIALVAKKIIREQLEFYRNKKRLEARAIIAPAEVIREATWKGDSLKGDLESLPVEQLTEKFPAALNKDGKPTTPA